MNNNVYCVIMAGGVGSRFWPLSRKNYPKQFIDILGTGKSLIQQTFDRFKDICPIENFMVVTHEDYQFLVKKQLPGLKDDQILCEPIRKNTAPCVAYAAYKIRTKNPNACIVVTPADHLILNESVFTDSVQNGIKQAQSEDCLVTLGIKPSRPDTGYGYIQFDTELTGVHKTIKKVITFTEKPDLEIAKTFLESGDFYWNSGIFIWSVGSIISALEKYLSSVSQLFEADSSVYYTPAEKTFITHAYQESKSISIDYGVMEKSDNVYVVLSDFGWSDLGTWGSLYTHLQKDEEENAIVARSLKMYESKDNIVSIMDPEKLVVLHGLEGYIVVDTDEVLLVCKKEDEQKIKLFVEDLKKDKRDNYS